MAASPLRLGLIAIALLLPGLAGALGPAAPAPDGHGNDLVLPVPLPGAVCPPDAGCLDIPLLVDEHGDTMFGDLTMDGADVVLGTNRLRYTAGDLTGTDALRFGGDRVCLELAAAPQCGDITAVRPGRGLVGGTERGDATLAVDTAQVCMAFQPGPGCLTQGWLLTGNAGTNPALNFLGTTDSQPLEIRVGNTRIVRLDPVTQSVTEGAPSNTATGRHSTVSGGRNNQAVAERTTVAGGSDNRATLDGATVSGGVSNIANGYQTTVGGGVLNGATAHYATVSGGNTNVASNQYAVVAGGNTNVASGESSAVLGGLLNTASGPTSVVGGGTSNANSGHNSVLGGGATNTVSGRWNSLGGGSTNRILGPDFSTIGGGVDNRIELGGGFNAFAATIAGGRANKANGDGAFIGGGLGNTANGGYSVVAGGNTNVASNGYAVVAGGLNNVASGSGSAVLGGDSNTASAGQSVVGGGISNANSGHRSVLGGGDTNTVSGRWNTLAGGSYNRILGPDSSTIGGGADNRIEGGGGFTGFAATIAGGRLNKASGGWAFIGGGDVNNASGEHSLVGGGYENLASGARASVLGGRLNTASGYASMVLGGERNTASAGYSLAAGWGASAAHDGSFVWADGTAPSTTVFASTANHQFRVRASGGVEFFTNSGATTGASLAPGSGTWSSASDRALKLGFEDVDSREVLAKVAALPLTEWSYIAQGPGVRHIGPMAQDFHAAFGLGEDDRHISSVDADGVALAAIQGLWQELQDRDARITQLEERLAALEEAAR